MNLMCNGDVSLPITLTLIWYSFPSFYLRYLKINGHPKPELLSSKDR